MVKLTPELSRSTGIDQKVKALQSHENSGVCALSKTISFAWSTQLANELKLRAQKCRCVVCALPRLRVVVPLVYSLVNYFRKKRRPGRNPRAQAQPAARRVRVGTVRTPDAKA